MKRSALRPSLPPVPLGSENVPRKRRVSFHNRTSVHLFRRRDQAKSLPSSPPQPYQVEERLNDETPSPRVTSPMPPLQPAQFVGFSSSDSGEFPLEPFHDARDGLSSSTMSLTGCTSWNRDRTQRRSSAFSTEMDTEKIFLFSSSPLSSPLPYPESPEQLSPAPVIPGGQVNPEMLASPDLSSSLMSFSTDPSNSEINHTMHQLEHRMASMSLQGLVEADQLDINQDSSLESDHCSPLDDGDSFTCFEIIEDSQSSSPSSPSLSWNPISEESQQRTLQAPEDSSSLALLDSPSPGTSQDASEGGTCSLTAFLDIAQVDFRMDDRSSRKVSLGFPSDSLTTLLARCSDTDPSLSAAQLRCKAFLIQHSLDVRQQFTKEHDVSPLQQRVDECVSSIEENAPDYLCVPVAMNYANRCRLQTLHRACVVKAKMEWNEEIRVWQQAHSQWLESMERTLHQYSKELEQQMISAVPVISPPRPMKLSRSSCGIAGKELNKIKEKLHDMAEELDILHGVVPWALTKSEHGQHSRTLILRFQQHYELSLVVDTTGGCNGSSTVSSIFYRRPQSPAGGKLALHSSESILENQREHIIQYLMSKSPLVQHRNSTAHLCSLVETFTVRLSRTFEFLSKMERHLERQQFVCTGVEYRTCNTDARALAKGLFLVRLRCYKMSDRQRVPATFGVEWKCNLRSAVYGVRQLSHGR